MKVKGGN